MLKALGRGGKERQRPLEPEGSKNKGGETQGDTRAHKMSLIKSVSGGRKEVIPGLVAKDKDSSHLYTSGDHVLDG